MSSTETQFELERILAGGLVSMLFQPITDPGMGSIMGYEALARGPADGPLHGAPELFGAARAAGRLLALERLTIAAAMERFTALDLPGDLFINITPGTLLAAGDGDPDPTALAARAGLAPERVVFEITEEDLPGDMASLCQVVLRLRRQGFRFAVDDLGAGFAGLRFWSELSPAFVKIDRHFIAGIEHDAVRMEFVRSMLDMARATRCQVVAEGVETRGEFMELAELGVGLIQGYFIARPDADPPRENTVPAALRPAAGQDGEPCARGLALFVPPIEPDARVADALARFLAEPTLTTLPVVKGGPRGRPVGLLRRLRLMELLTRPYHHEIYDRKPVARIMDQHPVVVEASTRIEQVSRLVTQGARLRLEDGFVVAEKGRYVGLGQIVDLLRQITELQVRTARHANPLTMLPGNVPIYDAINRLLAREAHFHVCYVDIDHFKPFNDYYGYARGDELLLYVAGLLKANLSPRVDFAGHLGGDDFVLVLRSQDWLLRLKRILKAFEKGVRPFYSDEDLARQGIRGGDRWGQERLFPLLSLSVAVLDSSDGDFRHAEEIAHALVDVKLEAKKAPGCSIATYASRGLVDWSVQTLTLA